MNTSDFIALFVFFAVLAVSSVFPGRYMKKVYCREKSGMLNRIIFFIFLFFEVPDI